jgi:hypothetical protein
MSRAESKEPLPTWIRQKLETLRLQAIASEQWPPMADQLLALVAGQKLLPKVDESDMDMFSLALHDALAGVDISQRYPTWWGKMLAAPALYQAFIEALELLEADGRQELTTAPPTSAAALTFLQTKEQASQLIVSAAGERWRAIWKLLFTQWQPRLFPTDGLAYRRATPWLEDKSSIILHDEVQIAQQVVEVVLEVIRSVEKPEILRLYLLAASEKPLPPLQVTLQWGGYAHMAVIDDYGRAQFPPLSLDVILDEAGEPRPTDLQLILESPQN